MIRYPISRPSITKLEVEYVTRAVESGWVSSLGEYIDAFERDFAAFCGTKYAISTSNGTTALHLALKALGIGAGDEVIVPDLSFVATANAVLMSGAKPVFADIDSENLCLSPDDFSRRITARTRAVMPVHLYGHPADMTAINSIAAEHEIAVIEDAAEAHGAETGGGKVGALGGCGIFSFYGNKILTTGEGGMITTNDPAINTRCRTLRDHAMSSVKRYWHDELGYNYRMTNLQAALGCAQLRRADELLGGRRQLFKWYREALAGVEGLQLNRVSDWASPSFWMICAEFSGIDEDVRGELMNGLKRRGVDSRPFFYPMSDMPYFETADTPVAHRVYKTGINLPTCPDLTQEDVGEIASIVAEEWARLQK
jgi:perosamine synthetase